MARINTIARCHHSLNTLLSSTTIVVSLKQQFPSSFYAAFLTQHRKSRYANRCRNLFSDLEPAPLASPSIYLKEINFASVIATCRLLAIHFTPRPRFSPPVPPSRASPAAYRCQESVPLAFNRSWRTGRRVRAVLCLSSWFFSRFNVARPRKGEVAPTSGQRKRERNGARTCKTATGTAGGKFPAASCARLRLDVWVVY